MDSQNALFVGSTLSAISSWSKPQILLFLSNMTKSDLLCLVYCVFTPNDSLRKNRFIDFGDVVTCRQHLVEKRVHTTTHDSSDSNENARNGFASLPSDIGAHIISFCDMRGRIRNKLISTDLYKFSAHPQARYHLLIDEKFVQGLYHDNVRANQFYNAKYLQLAYVFKNRNREQMEEAYYASLASILRKSPSLHTLHYDMLGKHFQSSFKPYSSHRQEYRGHFLQWMNAIQCHKHSAPTVFHSVNTFIFKPSNTFSYNEGSWRFRVDLLRAFLPNLRSYSVSSHCFYGHLRGTNEHYAEWEILSHADALPLQHLSCDTIMSAGLDRRLALNPLSHFHNFKSLRSLKLRLSLDARENNLTYYRQLISAVPVHAACAELHTLSVEFERVDFVTRSFSKLAVVDGVCKFLLRCCPNVLRYTLITNNQSDETDVTPIIHLLGKYDQLHSLDTDCHGLLQGQIRMISLKKLILRVQCTKNENSLRRWRDGDFLEEGHMEKACCDLSRFPSLEVFKLVIVQSSTMHYWRWQRLNANMNAIRFIQYVMKQTKNPQLKHVALSHCIQNHKRVTYRATCRPALRSYSYSEEICKLLVSLTCSQHLNLETMELKPIVLKPKEMEYLNFWFNGKISTYNTYSQKYKIFTDLICSQPGQNS